MGKTISVYSGKKLTRFKLPSILPTEICPLAWWSCWDVAATCVGFKYIFTMEHWHDCALLLIYTSTPSLLSTGPDLRASFMGMVVKLHLASKSIWIKLWVSSSLQSQQLHLTSEKEGSQLFIAITVLWWELKGKFKSLNCHYDTKTNKAKWFNSCDCVSNFLIRHTKTELLWAFVRKSSHTMPNTK